MQVARVDGPNSLAVVTRSLTCPSLPPPGATSPGSGEPSHVSTRLRLENDRLKREVSELRKLVSASGLSPGSSASSSAISPGPTSGAGDAGAASGGEGVPGFSVIADCDGNLVRVRSLETELAQTKEALTGECRAYVRTLGCAPGTALQSRDRSPCLCVAALKADRKRLKAEKFDLLNQMKQLYGTLEDKEKELRDFIRNYEQVGGPLLNSVILCLVL